MNNVRVKGFNDITFWQDSGIGVIVLRSDDNGMVNWNALNELITAVGTASMDDEVKAVALTGMNENFCTGMKVDENSVETAQSIMDASNSLISLIYSLEKPVFTILSGDAKNYGYEIALLGDVIISHKDNKVGFDPKHTFAVGGSITSLKFRGGLDVSNADSGRNVDLILARETLLEDSKNYILDHKDFSYSLIRRRLMKGLRESLLEERENLMKKYRSDQAHQ